jgi:soluble lytic murein transglycosylase-like protein
VAALPETLAELDEAFARSRRLAEARRRGPVRRRPRLGSRRRLQAVGALAVATVAAGGLSLGAAGTDRDGTAATFVRVNLGSRAAVVPVGCPVPPRFRRAFATASLKTGVPLSLLVATAYEESDMRPHALSHAGAIGLMQVMPGTAAELGLDARKPAENVMAGATYLDQLLERYDGDLTLALSAYNGGPKAVDEARGAPSAAVLRYAASVQSRAASLGACDAV